MTNFYVGQRVRIVKAFYPENEGREAIIEALFVEGFDEDTEESYIGHQITIVEPYSVGGVAFLWQLEPLTPPKAQETVSWEELPFTREGKWKEEQTA